MRIDEDSKIVWKIMDSLTAINKQKRECKSNCVKVALFPLLPAHGPEEGGKFLENRRHPSLKHNA